MAKRSSQAAALGAALLLGGCSFASDSLWPSLTGEAPSGGAPAQQIPPSAAEANAAPTLSPPAVGSTTFVSPGVTPGQPTGTFVGKKVDDLRGELRALQGRVTQNSGQLQGIRNTTTADSQRYHGTVAAITTRLQIGTTPGNPILVGQWNQAQIDLERLSADVSQMNSLANQVSADAAMSSYLLESARAAYGLSGAVDEDHRQLAILEDETNRTVVQIDRLLNELSADIARQTSYIAGERSNLTALALAIKNGELYGPSLRNRAYSAAPIAGAAEAQPSRAFAAEGRQPLVVIRFDRADVPYQQALYNAVSKTLERRPQANFELVSVAASQGNVAQATANQAQARRNAERVLRTLTDMGLPGNRVSVSATTSPQIATNEVHLYIR
jgi:hypothetical protein